MLFWFHTVVNDVVLNCIKNKIKDQTTSFWKWVVEKGKPFFLHSQWQRDNDKMKRKRKTGRKKKKRREKKGKETYFLQGAAEWFSSAPVLLDSWDQVQKSFRHFVFSGSPSSKLGLLFKFPLFKFFFISF